MTYSATEERQLETERDGEIDGGERVREREKERETGKDREESSRPLGIHAKY